MTDPSTPRQNHLLDALPAVEYGCLFPHLERVSMPAGQVLYESGGELPHAYFPTTCIVSLLYVMATGASAEIAVVGNEGIIGVALFMGGGTMPNRAVVRSAGCAYRLRAPLLQQESSRNGPLLRVLLRYTQALITQMAQTAVCNRHHSVDQQLCRWLLLSLDRLTGNELTMTQGLIANMLGVRREGVTEAAGKLHKAGLIDYRRGHITVLDRPGLEARVCECYRVVKMEFDRLLPSPRRGPLPSNIRAERDHERRETNASPTPPSPPLSLWHERPVSENDLACVTVPTAPDVSVRLPSGSKKRPAPLVAEDPRLRLAE